MKINFKLRLKNKAVLLALISACVTFIYQIFSIFEYVPPISSDMLIQYAGLFLNILVALGILVDPTTAGIGDSQQALGYTEPKKEV